MHDRYDQLKPGQIAAALRSYPRRYGAELARLSDPTLASRDRPDDTAALALVEGVAEAFRRRLAGLREIIVLGHASLDTDVLADTPSAARSTAAPTAPSTGPASGAGVAALADAAEQLAVVVDAASASDWNRAANRPDGSRLTAIDVARDAARVGADRLRELTHLIDGLVGPRPD